MSKTIKFILISFTVGIFAVFLFFTLAYKSFNGEFDKKHTREELTQNFIEHEKEFLDVVSFFKEKIPKNPDYSISFWQHDKKITLYIHPHDNKVIGATNVKIDSPRLDSALQILGWSKETLRVLAGKLKKTNCNYIGSNEWNDSIFDLSPQQEGWSSFSYRVWDKPIVDSLVSIHGAPIGNSGFAARVVLNYSSAL